jgi:DnaJ-domain-containing protein 1
MDRLSRIQQKTLKLFQEEMQGLMNDLLKDAFNPAKLMELIKRMGIDLSRFPGMVSQQPGFDPYQILGLDKSASDEEVKKRYRELMFKLHPDQSGTPGTRFLFQMVLAAFEMIKLKGGGSHEQ